MAKYQSTGFAFDRANIAGLDKEMQRGLNKYLSAREREINSFETAEVWCEGGPWNGRMIEFEGTGTFDLCVGEWKGRYHLGKWEGTEGKAPEAPEVKRMERNPASVAVSKELGKGYAALGQLLIELGEDPLERAVYVKHYKTVDVTEGARVDDFGSVITTPSPDGTYFVFKDYLNGRIVGRGKRKEWFYPEKVEAYRVESAHLVDDFGDLFTARKQADARTHPTRCITMRARATYKIGRTSYTIDATPAAADRLRDKVTKKKSIYSDRVLAAAEKQNAEARAARAVAQSVASAQASAAIEQAQQGAALEAVGIVQAMPLELEAVQRVEAECMAAGGDGAPGVACGAGQGHAGSDAAPGSQSAGAGGGGRGAGGGTKITGKSGHWRACFFADSAGDPALTFTGRDGAEVTHSYASGSERMRALQAMARDADKAVAMDARGAPGSGGSVDKPGTPGALSITLERVEGLIDDMGKPVTVATFAQAEALLLAWSATAPKNGCYYKTDFVVTWPDGQTYEGRYDLQHHSVARPSLIDHIASFCEYFLGLRKPEHMTETQYREAVARQDAAMVAACAATMERLKTHAGYFAKVQPVAVALGDLVAAGATVRDLVGLGVRDSGGRLGAAKSGAIVSAELCKWTTVKAVTLFEDGTRKVLTSWDFAPDGRYRLDGKVHGAPYFAQMEAAAAARTAQQSAAAEMQKQAKAKALIEIEAKYPHLVRTTKHGGVAVAQNIRLHLKKRFPGVKFSVRSEHRSVHVRWTGGPLCKDVDAELAPFDINDNDSMTDYAGTKSTVFSELFGGVHYLNTHRQETDAEIKTSLEHFFGSDGPSVEDYRARRQWSQVAHGNGRRSGYYLDEWHWLNDVRRHASGTFDY